MGSLTTTPISRSENRSFRLIGHDTVLDTGRVPGFAGFSLKKRVSHGERMAGDARYTLRTLRKGLLVLEVLKRHVKKAGEEISAKPGHRA